LKLKIDLVNFVSINFEEYIMSRKCQVTGKTGLVGNMVSHSKRRTLMRQQPNLQTKRFFIPEESRWVKIKVSAAGLRTIDKRGILAVAKELGL
jgi:large subunit ribosomal protein L28